MKKEIEYWGVTRITNPKTLQRWKDNGNYLKLINLGYIFADGCGRFKKEICSCCKCRKPKVP
jgi:hypothetical protein